jgi:putative NADPH-quinone reductase
MSRRILIINGNPDADPARLTSALAQAYQEGAHAGGHETRRLDIGTLSFPFLTNARDFQKAADNPDIVAAQQAILWADHLVFVFPLWLGSVPALLKAFMEQIARNQFALKENPRGFPRGQLGGRSAHVVVTMGMPALFYRLLFGAHGVSAFTRSILRFSGIHPIRRTYLGGAASPDVAAKWITQLRSAGARAH